MFSLAKVERHHFLHNIGSASVYSVLKKMEAIIISRDILVFEGIKKPMLAM